MGSAVDNRRVLVIGAGAAGLLIAQILKKHDIPCRVFEQDASPQARPRDWNYGIYWAQSNLSECLPPDLAAQLPSVQVDSHTPAETDFLPVFNGETGQRLVDLPAPYMLRLQRRKFLDLIASGIDIKYSKRIARVQSDGTTATATFEDGSQETGRLLIGTEGAHSRVREFLLGKEQAALKPSPLVASASLTRLPETAAEAVRSLHPRYWIALHPDNYFHWFGIHNQDGPPEEWQFMTLISWISEEDKNEDYPDNSAIMNDFKKRAEVFGEPFRSIVRAIPSDSRFWHNRLSFWPTQPWDGHNGTVTLAGDAAHPMTFHRGQGLNNAILDAASLGRQLAALESKTIESLPTAVAEYEHEMWERGREAVEMSNVNSLSLHNWDELKNSPLFKAGLKQNVQ